MTTLKELLATSDKQTISDARYVAKQPLSIKPITETVWGDGRSLSCQFVIAEPSTYWCPLPVAFWVKAGEDEVVCCAKHVEVYNLALALRRDRSKG